MTKTPEYLADRPDAGRRYTSLPVGAGARPALGALRALPLETVRSLCYDLAERNDQSRCKVGKKFRQVPCGVHNVRPLSDCTCLRVSQQDTMSVAR